MAAALLRSARRAFTLVELLVVIGIIAVLVGVLLPVLGRARARAQTVACQSNLRQIAQATLNYTAENKGSFPWGFIFNRQRTDNGRPSDGGASGYIAWFGSADKYMTKGQTDIIPLDVNTGFFDGATSRKFNKAFRCPGIDASVFKQQVHYYNHGVVMPHMPLELNPGRKPPGQSPVRAPAKVNQVYPETALFWDTNGFSDAFDTVPNLFWGAEGITGYSLLCTQIDDNEQAPDTENALLSHPELPERRYRGPGSDRFAGSGDPLRNPSGPIAFASDEFVRSIGGPGFNIDYGGDTVWNLGNARFRHIGLG